MNLGFKPIKIKTINFLSKNRRRTLNRRDRDILYLRSSCKCEGCGKRLLQPHMQVGHRKAYSKGGATTLTNSACLCYTCNKLQGTGSLEILKKKLNGTYGKRNKKISKGARKRKSFNPLKIKPIRLSNFRI